MPAYIALLYDSMYCNITFITAAIVSALILRPSDVEQKNPVGDNKTFELIKETTPKNLQFFI